ncbi:MAG: hypothetical protein OEM41_09305 [Ignavibacteria bacterium]|nr:hypothetical protein [Ignavibacteria bacterium]
MPHRWIGYVLLITVILPSVQSHAQTTVNPDISVIPRFRIDTNDGGDPGNRAFSRPDFTFEELEIAIQAYLNPFAKGDVVLTLPGPDLENGKVGVEEVYGTVVRGLPLDLNVRFGKYRVEFGKINMVHPHAWPFVTQPLSQERFLGEEGLNDLGISASVLLPTGDVYTKLTVDLLRGSVIGEATGIEDTTEGSPTYANSARLSSFFTLTDYSDLELGLSSYTGIHDPYNRDRFWYWNLDFKYKYRPGSYTSLVLQGEYLVNTRRAVRDRDLVMFVDAGGNPERRRITTSGFYVYADYQFEKIYSVGARFDWSQAPYSPDDKATAVAIFLGYYPVEETIGVRLQYQHTNNQTPGVSQSVNAFALQVLFSLGPHKAHPF